MYNNHVTETKKKKPREAGGAGTGAAPGGFTPVSAASLNGST